MRSSIKVDIDGPVRVITLNRPERYNAFDSNMHDEFKATLHQLDRDRGTGAIVVTGNGKAFCGGGDLNVLTDLSDPRERRELMRDARDLVATMIDLQVPLISAVNGPAVGLGCSIALLSDLVFMSERAFLADTHVALGVVAGDGGAICLPFMISMLLAKEYLLTGDRIPAARARELGLANRVTTDELLLPEAIEMATRLSALPRQAVQDTKHALNLALKHAALVVGEFAYKAESESFGTKEFHQRIEEQVRGRP